MAAGYAEKIADEVLENREVVVWPEEPSSIRDMLAEAAERGYKLGFGARA